MRWMLGVLMLLLFSVAAAPAGLVLTPESAVRRTLGNNPELQAARQIVAEAEGRAKASGRLSNPELETEIAGGRDFEGRVEIGLTQRFPLTSRLRLERNLSALEIEMARLEVQEKERQFAAATRIAFVELAVAREAVVTATKQVEIAEAFAASLRGQFKEGMASDLDASQATLAAEDAGVRKENLRVEECRASAAFATVLGLPAETEFALKGSFDLPKSLPPHRPLGWRPDIRLAELAAEAGDVDISLAKASRWEDIGIGIFMEGERFRDEPEGIEPESLLGMRISIPLPLWQNGSGKVAEKNANRERRERELQALKLAARNEAVSTHRILAVRHRTALKVESGILPAARKQAANAEAAYRRGETDIQSVFRARERLVEAETIALETRRAFHLSLIQWLSTVGGNLVQP